MSMLSYKKFNVFTRKTFVIFTFLIFVGDVLSIHGTIPNELGSVPHLNAFIETLIRPDTFVFNDGVIKFVVDPKAPTDELRPITRTMAHVVNGEYKKAQLSAAYAAGGAHAQNILNASMTLALYAMARDVSKELRASSATKKRQDLGKLQTNMAAFRKNAEIANFVLKSYRDFRDSNDFTKLITALGMREKTAGTAEFVPLEWLDPANLQLFQNRNDLTEGISDGEKQSPKSDDGDQRKEEDGRKKSPTKAPSTKRFQRAKKSSTRVKPAAKEK